MLTLSILGLAGCALIVIAFLADWRDHKRYTRSYGQPYVTTTLKDLR